MNQTMWNKILSRERKGNTIFTLPDLSISSCILTINIFVNIVNYVPNFIGSQMLPAGWSLRPPRVGSQRRRVFRSQIVAT
jgi:hypothetical protein